MLKLRPHLKSYQLALIQTPEDCTLLFAFLKVLIIQSYIQYCPK